MRATLISFDFGEYCLSLANALSERVDLTLIVPFREIAPLQEKFDPRVKLLPFHRPRLRQPVRQAKMCAEIVQAVRRVDPDVVHLQQGHLWLNPFLHLLGSRPLVVTIHDPAPHAGDRGAMKTPQRAMNLAFRRADQLIVHADRLKQDVITRRRLAPDTVHVIPHVAIGEAVRPKVARSGPRHEVLFFGRIWPYKGLEHLIRAEPMVSAAVEDVRFVIAGEGEDLERYRRMMVHPERFEIQNEFVSLDRRAELFERASVVVLPYVEASQSGVVPVAYSFGKPVVATAVGGLPEVVEDGRTGLLVPPANAPALAEAIISLLCSPALSRELGSAGLSRLRSEWAPSRVAAQTLEVYELARSARRPKLAEAA